MNHPRSIPNEVPGVPALRNHGGDRNGPSSLHLNISRIAVEGLEPGGQKRFVRALQAGLTELAQRPALRDTLRAEPLDLRNLRAGTMRSGATPEDAAKQVVRSLERHLLGAANRPEHREAVETGAPHA